MVQDVCKVAGYEVPAPFPRITYAQAMRELRHRQARHAHPADAPGAATCCRNWRMPGCRWWRSTFRRAARPAARSATSSRHSAQERGLRVYDDAKRLERDYPEQMAKVRERCGAEGRQPAGAGRMGRRAQGPSSRRRPSTRPAASCACTAPTSSTTATSCSTRRISSSSGWWISRCSNGTTRTTAGWPRTIPSRRCTTRISIC